MNYDKRSADTAALLKGANGVEVMTTSEKASDAEVAKTGCAGPKCSRYLLIKAE